MPQIYGKAQTFQPSAVAENQVVLDRMTKYGDFWEVQVLRGIQGAALEGSLYVARATPAVGGSGVAMGIQTTFSDTANVPVVLSNGDSAKSYIPVYIKGRITAAGASTTSAEIAVEVDNIARYSSGGTSLTINRVNTSSSAPASNATCRVGAVTAAAAGGSRMWTNSYLIRKAAAPCWIVNDVCWFLFGLDGGFGYSKSVAPSDTTADPGNVFTFPLLPVAIPAGGTMLVHIANVANATTPPSLEWEVAWIER
jgi:hypothetical protein